MSKQSNNNMERIATSLKCENCNECYPPNLFLQHLTYCHKDTFGQLTEQNS